MIDSSAQLVWQTAYLPFGKAQIVTETIENNFRFPGQYCDNETGLHYNYYRYYDPASGRYLASDPVGLKNGVNVYAYVKNDPVNAVDTQRLWTFTIGVYLNGTLGIGGGGGMEFSFGYSRESGWCLSWSRYYYDRSL